MATNYQMNRDKILTYQKKYYHKKIKEMTNQELEEFRSKKSSYYKSWYQENREELSNRRRERDVDINDLGGYIIRRKRGRPKADEYDPPRQYKKRSKKELEKVRPFDNGTDKSTSFKFL